MPADLPTRPAQPGAGPTLPGSRLGSRLGSGLGSGLLGVLIFSGSLPATRLAVADFSPLFLTASRATLAAAFAGLVLLLLRQPWPRRADLGSLTLVALGVVAGFPLLTALALQHISSAHAIVHVALLPLATALFGVLRAGERPRPGFWLFACLGSAAVAGFAWSGMASPQALAEPRAALDGQAGSTGQSVVSADLLMVAAIAVCGLGYAEGAVLSRRLGGWQVISWALLLSLPAMLGLGWLTRPDRFSGIGLPAWAGLAYVSLFSMWLGFVFWYRGLAIGGIARIGQLQLLQPLAGLALAHLVLGEVIAPSMLVATIAVIACVALARRQG